MKIKLKNFRCYIEKEFDFGDTGLVLLSGASGSGKTTILSAIMFALFDTGTKLVTIGKTTCEVLLQINHLTIKRTKRPNRLVVKDNETDEEYEDDAAQSIINNYFGSTFTTTSYVPQNTSSSFILMTPVQKLEFLEHFAIQGLDIESIKDRCKQYIKTSENDLTSTTSQLTLATTHFQTLIKPVKVKAKGEMFIKNEPIRLKNSILLLKKEEKKVDELITELTNAKIASVETKEIESLEKKLDTLNTEIVNLNFTQIDPTLETELNSIVLNKKFILLKEQYEKDNKQLEQMIQKEETERQNQLLEIQKTLWIEYSKKETDEIILETQNALSDVYQVQKFQKQLSQIKVSEIKELKEKLTICKQKLEEGKTYKCPSCNSSLQFENNELKITHFQPNVYNLDSLKTEISKIEKTIIDEENKKQKIFTLEEDIQKIKDKYEEFPNENELKETLEQINDYKQTQIIDEKRKVQLENKKKSSTISLFEIQLKKTDNDLKHYTTINFKESNRTEEELRSLIFKQKETETIYNGLRKQSVLITKEICDRKNKLCNYRDILLIENDIEETKKIIFDLKEKIKTHEENIKQIIEYQKYIEDIKAYNLWEKKILELKKQEDEYKKIYSATTLLKEKILEAESLAVSNIINSINTHAQEYLDLFFPNEPIVVRLTPFKTDKKQNSKPQINIEIDYKGTSSDISMLSGGEIARVVLAYTLSLTEIVNPPIIMLDEATASLDQEATSIVMEGIKKEFSNKLVLVIAHQVISGEFDRQISL